MKKLIYLLPAACLFFLLPGCTKNENSSDDQECDEEYVVGHNIYDGADFANYLPGQYFNGNYYLTDYTTFNTLSGTLAGFSLGLEVTGLCNSYYPNINFQLLLDTPDSSITCAGALDELNSGGYEKEYTIVPNGTLYNYNSDHVFVGEPNGSAETLRLSLLIAFPTQGSYSADSAYFFSNLSSARVGLIGKYPKQ